MFRQGGKDSRFIENKKYLWNKLLQCFSGNFIYLYDWKTDDTDRADEDGFYFLFQKIADPVHN